MLTDTLHEPLSPNRFILLGLAWSLVFFGLLRVSWAEAQLVLPLTRVQARIATGLFGAPALPVAVTLACSGTDAMALCLGAFLAYPVKWRTRLAGAAGGIALVLALNTLRIGALGRAAASPAWFNTLHVYVWPAALTLAIAGYVFAWMRFVDRPGETSRTASLQPSRRFVVLSVVFLVLFSAAAPIYLESPRVLVLAALVARAAAAILSAVGVDAHATGNVLSTSRGGFLVTQECVSTPLIPVFFAAVIVYARVWWSRALWCAAALPLFAALGIARLLVVAVPVGFNSSPAFLIHAFSQLLVAGALVCSLALWRHGARPATAARVAAALAVAVAFALVAGPLYTRAVLWFRSGAPVFDDSQGALTFVPAFQSGLFLAIWIAAFANNGWTRFLCGASLLAVTQVAADFVVQQLAARAGVTPTIPMIRAWALLGPVVVLAMVVSAFRRTSESPPHLKYRAFWNHVGAEFPDLGGAASTALYFENEKRLIGRYLGALAGQRVLKTDLWDEARNTRILQWVGRQGAEVVGVDISAPVVRLAGTDVLSANADVRALPFADGTFDAVYPMGTIEHFPETDLAVREVFRVLKPGGRAIVGVPNRHDPFLRPLMVALLYRLGLYGYGFEKSYSRKALRQMLEDAGFVVTGDDAILFIPGWLRMLDLLCHTRYPPGARLTSAGVRVFRWIDRHVPAVRRHGYLVAAIGERPSPHTAS